MFAVDSGGNVLQNTISTNDGMKLRLDKPAGRIFPNHPAKLHATT